MSTDGTTVLLVDADRGARAAVTAQLAADGYDVLAAGSLGSARRLLMDNIVDVAVVDRVLPDGDGLELLGFVRDAGLVGAHVDVDLPIILTSARASLLDRVRGLERGCDDYISSPYHYSELRARIGALLRRRHRLAAGARLRIGPLEVNALARQAWVDGRPVTLSSKEFSLLQTLAREPTRVFRREELMATVWGWAADSQVGYRTRTLDQHASRLRRKLSAHGAHYVINVWGVGYKLVDVTAPHRSSLSALSA
jgi:DNA-binding response OmpR family regulator